MVISIDGGVVRAGEQAADMKLTAHVHSFTDTLFTERCFSVVDVGPNSAAPKKNHGFAGQLFIGLTSLLVLIINKVLGI
jgi:hypothetical protein